MDVTGAGSQQLQRTAPVLPQSWPLHHSHSCSWGKGDKCISDHLFGLWYHSHMKGEEIIAVIIMSLWFYV